MTDDFIVGIDLGTTNSSIAAYRDGAVHVFGSGDKLLPSCLALSDDGTLLVGRPARNQAVLHPERTLKSIKRRMGEDVSLPFGDRTLTPPEASALLLRELASWVEKETGKWPERAVVTVPAYFTDAQRNATREAGAIAGLDVVRLLNEPTAASLAYGEGADGKAATALVYDLGGGTFDVSIVRIEGDVTEVLASHGDTRLGGDDFTDLLAGRLRERFLQKHGPHSLDDQPAAMARLWWAAEAAKRRLSDEPYVQIREEHLVVGDKTSLHLETELSRDEYNDLIHPLLERTLESVTRAREAAGPAGREVDAILLVGGSTRTPLVAELLRERSRLEPRRDLHPDLCVALGAGTLAARLSGKVVKRVLVDVSAHSFGVSHLGVRDGQPYPHCYKAILERNTPLPLTRSEMFYTAQPYQEKVQVTVFQGENPDALLNIPLGDFWITGLQPTEEPNPVVMRMSLDLDGVLHASATEKGTGLGKEIVIDGATRTRTPEEIEAARSAMADLHSSYDGAFDSDGGTFDGEDDFENDADDFLEADAITIDPDGEPKADEAGEEPPESDASAPDLNTRAAALKGRAEALLDSLHAEDREDAQRLCAAIDEADTPEALREAVEELGDLLYFVEGR